MVFKDIFKPKNINDIIKILEKNNKEDYLFKTSKDICIDNKIKFVHDSIIDNKSIYAVKDIKLLLNFSKTLDDFVFIISDIKIYNIVQKYLKNSHEIL